MNDQDDPLRSSGKGSGDADGLLESGESRMAADVAVAVV